LPLMGIAAIKTFGERTTVKLALRLCRLLGRCALFAIGLAITVLFWMHVNRNHFEQAHFLVFAKLAAGRPPTFENWMLSRWDSLRNTLLPGFLLIANRRNPAINNIYGPSPITAQISFLYWNTLPFGTGVVFYLTSVPCLVIAAFRWALPWLILVFAVPFIFFTTYMGAVSTGMLRDGLHTWFLGFMIFLVVIWCRFLRHSERFWKVSSVAIGIRGIEILVMLIIPSALSQHMLYQTRYALSDLISLAVMVVSTVFLVRSAFCLSEFLRREQRNAETV
jgi:hypothetical protein